MAFFDIPLDLPHAGTIADRIVRLLGSGAPSDDASLETALDIAERISALLFRYSALGENPPAEEGEEVRQRAATLGREMVGLIESEGRRDDRLGQCVRNLFECLEMGEEGAALSLRAGENPNSLQRPG